MLNYNENCVCINIAPGKTLKIEPASFGEPTMVPLTLDEIRYANNGRVFKSGLLEFPEDIENELYDELRIEKSSVLKLNEIREILISPTKEGLIKLLSITSMFEFDRVRGQFQKLKYEGHKLTLDIADLIEKRMKELFNNQIKSSIQIEDNDAVSRADNKRVAELERQLEEMKKLISKSFSADPVKSDSDESTKESVATTSTKKSPGRPKKSTE